MEGFFRMKWFYIALRNVWGNKRRSITAILTVSVALSSLILAYGYINFSFWGLTRSIVQGGTGNIQVLDKQFESAFEKNVLDFGLEGQRSEVLVTNLLTDKRISNVLRRVEFSGIVSTGENSAVFYGVGVEPRLERRLNGRNITGGYTMGKGLKKDNAYEVVLGKTLMEKLNVKLGDSVTVLSSTVDGGMNGIDLVVVGAYDTGVPMLNGLEIKVPLQVAQEILMTDKVSKLVIQLRDINATELVIPTVKKIVGDNLWVRSWQDIAPYFKAVENVYMGIFIVMGSIITLVVLLSVSNVMNTAVLERVPEIGTLRAFGISQAYLKLTFVLEGIIISFVGCIVGIILAMIIVVFINSLGYLMPPPPGRSLSYPLMILPTLNSILLKSILMVFISAVASYIPIRKILRKKIVEQLLYV